MKYGGMTESEEQQLLMQWANANTKKYPELWGLMAVPNGGHRSKRTAGRMKAEGVKAGYPDLALDVARGGFWGLRVELKRERRSLSRISDRQTAWHTFLLEQGYAVHICHGWRAAAAVIETYLQMPKTRAA